MNSDSSMRDRSPDGRTLCGDFVGETAKPTVPTPRLAGGANLPSKTPSRVAAALTLGADDLVDPADFGAVVARSYAPPGRGDSFGDLAIGLERLCKQVASGNLLFAERTMVAQAVGLNAMFTNLAYRASAETDIDRIERFMRLGLRCQSLCRATLETLALIKNPHRPSFIRQQNVAVNQQVNGGGPAREGQRNPAEQTIGRRS